MTSERDRGTGPRRAPDSRDPGLGRRAFLRRLAVGGGATGLLVAAPSLLASCGSSGGSGTTMLTLSTAVGGRDLVGMFDVRGDYAVTGVPQRLVLILSSVSGGAETQIPPTLPVTLALQGEPPSAPITLTAHTDGAPIPYYPLVTTFDRPGTWTVTTELDGQPSSVPFLVQTPQSVPLVQVGQPMPPVDTPTTADARGVTPICTADPPCPLHDVTLAAALAAHEPVALLVASPAYCQVGSVCAPLLDLLLEQRAAHPAVHFLHAEPYLDPAGTEGQPAARGVTPVVSDLGLTFEPSLFVVNANGVVTARLDDDYDRGELGTALSAV